MEKMIERLGLGDMSRGLFVGKLSAIYDSVLKQRAKSQSETFNSKG